MTRWERWLSVLLLLFGLYGCVNDNAATEEIAVECAGDDVPSYEFPYDPNWTFLDMTVGDSTEQDVIERFGVPELTRLFPEDNPRACIYVYEGAESYNRFRVWLAGNRVIGLEFGQLYPNPAFQEVEIPQTFDELKEAYGRAQLVGFSRYGYGVRSVVWLQEGIQAEISFDVDGVPIETIRYFSPMDQEKFEASPWSTLVLDENLTLCSTCDLRDYAPRDPFDWN